MITLITILMIVFQQVASACVSIELVKRESEIELLQFLSAAIFGSFVRGWEIELKLFRITITLVYFRTLLFYGWDVLPKNR